VHSKQVGTFTRKGPGGARRHRNNPW
jgi:hypothetical protein